MQVMLEATVVVQTLHLAQVTNNSFGNHIGSFFSEKRLADKTASLLVIIHQSLLKERILIMNLDHRDYGHVNLFHVGLDVVSLV